MIMSSQIKNPFNQILYKAIVGGGLLKYDLGRDNLMRLEKKTHLYTNFVKKLDLLFYI